TTLTSDIGPCAGHGIVVKASGVTLNLNGHKVLGTPERLGDFAGILLAGVSDVQVIGGTGDVRGLVRGFDAGVALLGGARNTVTKLKVTGNLGAPEPTSTFGDGIVLFNSSENHIVQNDVRNNGIWDGIGVLGVGSAGNTIQDNVVEENTDDELAYYAPGGGSGVIVNVFLDPNDPRRGESTSLNNVIQNTIRRNVNSGISNISNNDALIQANLVEGNGYHYGADGTRRFGNLPGNGIGLQAGARASQATRDRVEQNIVQGNAGTGIDVNSQENRIIKNVSTGNGSKDLFDSNFNCDANVWLDNVYDTFYPECTTATSTPSASVAIAALAPTPPAQAKTPPQPRVRSMPPMP
ncbi:MAG: right-handed parallel beta-helix repeat-containing protein, partial [Actinobacteria bacterium]|nr:right-handed parallel beta-helix repeat-containing protein [Actinomycetota bacterium]